jgi:hypothetical protein
VELKTSPTVPAEDHAPADAKRRRRTFFGRLLSADEV